MIKKLSKIIVISFLSNYILLKLSVSVLIFFVDRLIQVRMREDFPEIACSILQQMSIHGNLLLFTLSYYALVHASLLLLFRMTMDNVYVIYRMRTTTKLFTSLRRPTLVHNLNFIRLTVHNVRLVNKLNIIFSKVCLSNIALDVPICAAILVQVAMGRISEDFFLPVLQMFGVMAATVLGTHILFGQYPALLHGNVKLVIRFVSRNSLRNNLRAQLKLNHYIEHFHTHKVLGVHYGPLGVITRASFIRVSVGFYAALYFNDNFFFPNR